MHDTYINDNVIIIILEHQNNQNALCDSQSHNVAASQNVIASTSIPNTASNLFSHLPSTTQDKIVDTNDNINAQRNPQISDQKLASSLFQGTHSVSQFESEQGQFKESQQLDFSESVAPKSNSTDDHKVMSRSSKMEFEESSRNLPAPSFEIDEDQIAGSLSDTTSANVDSYFISTTKSQGVSSEHLTMEQSQQHMQQSFIQNQQLQNQYSDETTTQEPSHQRTIQESKATGLPLSMSSLSMESEVKSHSRQHHGVIPQDNQKHLHSEAESSKNLTQDNIDIVNVDDHHHLYQTSVNIQNPSAKDGTQQYSSEKNEMRTDNDVNIMSTSKLIPDSGYTAEDTGGTESNNLKPELVTNGNSNISPTLQSPEEYTSENPASNSVTTQEQEVPPCETATNIQQAQTHHASHEESEENQAFSSFDNSSQDHENPLLPLNNTNKLEEHQKSDETAHYFQDHSVAPIPKIAMNQTLNDDTNTISKTLSCNLSQGEDIPEAGVAQSGQLLEEDIFPTSLSQSIEKVDDYASHDHTETPDQIIETTTNNLNFHDTVHKVENEKGHIQESLPTTTRSHQKEVTAHHNFEITEVTHQPFSIEHQSIQRRETDGMGHTSVVPPTTATIDPIELMKQLEDVRRLTQVVL